MKTLYFDNGPYLEAFTGHGKQLNKALKANHLLWGGFLISLGVAGVTAWKLWQTNKQLKAKPLPSTLPNSKDTSKEYGS